MRVKIFETVTASGLEKDINAFLEENQGMIDILDLKYRLTTSTHGVVIIYKFAGQGTESWNRLQ